MNKILDRIEALLSMTVENGCSEHEADTAATKAVQLLLAYNISPEQIAARLSSEEETTHKTFPCVEGRSFWKWQSPLARSCAKVTNCVLFTSRGRYGKGATVTFIGTLTNIEACHYLFHYLCIQAVSISKKEQQHARYQMFKRAYTYNLGKGWLEAFLYALQQRIGERLEDLYLSEVEAAGEAAKTYSMQVYNANQSYAERFKLKYTNYKVSGSTSGSSAGRKAGDKIDIPANNKLGNGLALNARN